MQNRYLLSVVALAATTAVGFVPSSAAMAAPATATPDPAIYAIGYDNDYLYTVDVGTGVGTPLPNQIGMGPIEHLGGAFNPKDGVLYATNSQSMQCALWSIDTATGIGQKVWEPAGNLPDGNPFKMCSAMMFTPEGDLYMSTRSTGNLNYVSKMNPLTGAVLQSWDAPFGSIMNFMVVSPQDGLYYMQTSNDDDDMYTFDPTDPTSGAFINVANGNNQTMYGAAFLPDGTILANSWSDLVSVNLATLGAWSVIGQIAPTDIGVLVNGTQYWPSPAPEAELPATGLNVTTLSVAALGALVVVALGFALVVRRRKA